MTPTDPWTVSQDHCAWCGQPIHSAPMIEPSLAIEAPPRVVRIWTHVDTGHERCTDQDTLAQP
jgi:hypothetical protein